MSPVQPNRPFSIYVPVKFVCLSMICVTLKKIKEYDSFPLVFVLLTPHLWSILTQVSLSQSNHLLSLTYLWYTLFYYLYVFIIWHWHLRNAFLYFIPSSIKVKNISSMNMDSFYTTSNLIFCLITVSPISKVGDSISSGLASLGCFEPQHNPPSSVLPTHTHVLLP